MASYDKGKLIGLLERKRAAYITLRDYSTRASSAQDALNRHISHMRSNASEMTAGDAIDRLLLLPLSEAAALKRADVEEYQIQRGSLTDARRTGVPFGMWEKYLSMRASAERLRADQAMVQGRIDSQFAVITHLVAAVKKWGFADPELEVI
jgi:hypothetical protein